MATLTAEERAARERRELARWEGFKDRGEKINRENRRLEAQKAREDGVEVRRQKPQQSTRM